MTSNIYDWCHLNALVLNMCQRFLFGSEHFKRLVGGIRLEAAGVHIPLYDTVKNLVVVFDKNLTFSQYVTMLRQKVFPSLKL